MKSEGIKFKLDNIYNIFNNSNSPSTERNTENDYLSSQEFENDADYWKNYLSDIGNYVRFHNIKSDDYKSVKLQFKNERYIDFLKKHSVSRFEFITAIFSLYLSRIDRTEGCLLKTMISDDLSYKNTILKIEYLKDSTFIDYLNEVKEVLSDAVKHTNVDIINYIEDIVSYYSIYDFRDMGDISILNGKDSALTLNIYSDSLELIYNCDLFSDIYMKHMADNIESLIAAAVNDSSQPLNKINILSSDEISLLSKFSKGKTVEVDEDKTLSKAFREHATAEPESLAVDDGVNRVTYGELEHTSNSIANDLQNNNSISLGSHVALMLPRNYHFPELALALNKLGACFIPIDNSYPDKRIEHMLNISEAECIITTEEFAESHDFKIKTICIEDLNDDMDVELDIKGNSDDLFVIMFTSGTSGLPKGVTISNRQMTQASFSFKHIFNLSYGDVLGCYLSFSFVASVVIYASLILGCCSRIFNEKEQKDSLLLIKELKENHINSLILPPSLGIPIIENEDLKLDYLVLAGAKLSELIKKERHTKIVNFYGTTEIIFAATKIYNMNDVESNYVPIGRPITNTWVYILDKDGNQMPLSVPGEICVSSNQISQGYYNNPELTNEVFVDNPHCTCKGNERMYRTGDIGFYNFNGEIEIVGREDDQLSVRGFRIESDEILSIMNQYPEISDIYLDVDYDNLIAYYTVNDKFDIDTVKEKLKVELPQYMLPSLFVELKEIPLNPNGKIDKFSLKENNVETNIGDDVMNVVVNAFKEVLHRDAVLIDDDFVALGGTSLSAMNLQILLKERLGVDLYSRDIMELATPVNITNHIRYNLDIYSAVDINYSFEDLCPLSESQLNVYLDERVNEMGTAYNNPFMIEFNKHYSSNEIRKALDKLLDAHPVLSARVIQNNEILSFSFDAKPQINGLKNDIASFVQPFELEKSLSRFMIVENNESNCLCADFHHLIVDGSSANIIFNSLISILEGNDADFIDNGVLRQISFEEHIDSDYMENAHEFFDLMLSDADETYELLPCVKTDDENDFKYSETFNIDNDKLNSFINNHSITPNQFFSSVFAYTLSRFTGSSKVLFNLIDDGRGHIDLSKSAGMFVRTLPLLIDCKNQKIDSFLDYSSKLINSVMKYDIYPFRILASEYDLNSDILFQYSHDLFYSLINEEKLNYKVSELRHDVIGDLSFYIFNVKKDKLGIRILYSEKFSKDFIEHFAQSYKLILKEIMDAEVLSDINYTLKSDLDILNSYNQTQNDLNYNDVLDAFNDNLAKYPDNTLVSFKDRSYSYSEGAFIADKLAKRLKESGVNLQDPVSFMVERSELYMLCTLGILSIGCVYVPLDDDLPDERIKFMLNDSGSRIVIVSDETYERAHDLTDEIVLLNISEIIEEDIGTLSKLPVVYGDLACILYTSGTTGIPKGVKIRRKGINNFVDYYVNKYDMHNDSTFGLFSSIGFDVGAIRGICAPIYGGSSLDIIPNEIRLNMDKLNNHFIDRKVTHTTLPTQVARMFINEIESTSLKVLNTGGEKLGDIDYATDYSFIDSYGPTECSVAVCDIEVKDKIDSSSIGHLFTNTKGYILDNENRRVPIGAVGELCISGNQIADGYLNRQKETDASFVENPFDSNEEYSMMYRTGDLVRALSDGTFAIVGRQDGQVKIRGNRVELSEVEKIIREMNYIEEVTVQTIDNDGNNELVAYIVSKDGHDHTDEIQKYVGENKPDYMVPSFVVKLDKIPLTVNGKVDKRALPEVDRSALHAEYAAPRNKKEKDIVNAFEKIFNREKISIYDDFIRLGGDSLIAIKLLSYLEEYDVTTSEIFNLRTPADIVDNIKDISMDLDIYSVDEGCPLNSDQANLFADSIINDNFDFYQIPNYINIPKKYGLEKILEALDKMFELHPILNMHLSDYYGIKEKKSLHTRIQDNINVLKELGNSKSEKNGKEEILKILRNKGWNIKSIIEMIPIVLRLFKGEYPYMVKGSKPPISIEQDYNEDIVKNFLDEPLDLYNYLSRFKIVEMDDYYLLMAKFHHIIFDGISSNVFKHDFQVLLDGGKVKMDDSFLKMAAFTQQVKNTDQYSEAVDFYDSMLSAIGDVKGLIKDNSSEGFSINTFDFELNQDALKSFLDKTGLSENALFTSIFAYTLSRFSASDTVSFSMIDNGRDRFNDYDSIGLYAGVVPLLINCKDQSVSSYIQYSSNIIYNVLKYNYYPIFLISTKYGFDVDIIFQYVPEWISYDVVDNENIGLFSSEGTGDIINDLLGNTDNLIAEFIVQMFQKGEDYSLMFVYSNDHSYKMVEDFAETYNQILSNIINADMTSDLSSILKKN